MTREDDPTIITGEDSFDSPDIFNPSWGELEVGTLLGSGSFARVYKVKPVDDSDLLVKDEDNLNSTWGTLSMVRSFSNSSNQRLYALKIPNSNVSQAAIVGFKFEALLLSELPKHDNIIHLIGVSSNVMDYTTLSFLVLEHLTGESPIFVASLAERSILRFTSLTVHASISCLFPHIFAIFQRLWTSA